MKKPLLWSAIIVCSILVAAISYFGVFGGANSHRLLYILKSEAVHNHWVQQNSSHGSMITFGKYTGKDTWLFKVKEGDNIRLDYDLEISEGLLGISIVNSRNEEALHIETQGKCNGIEETTSNEDATWKVVIMGENAKGEISFEVR